MIGARLSKIAYLAYLAWLSVKRNDGGFMESPALSFVLWLLATGVVLFAGLCRKWSLRRASLDDLVLTALACLGLLLFMRDHDDGNRYLLSGGGLVTLAWISLGFFCTVLLLETFGRAVYWVAMKACRRM